MFEPTSEEVTKLVSVFQKLATWPKADLSSGCLCTIRLPKCLVSHIRNFEKKSTRLSFFSCDTKC